MITNREHYYNELRCRVGLFKDKPDEHRDQIKQLIDAFVTVFRIYDEVMDKGVLVLDEAKDRDDVKELICGNELSWMIGMAMEDIKPETMENICWNRLSARDYLGSDAIVFIFYLDVILRIISFVSCPGQHFFEQSSVAFLPKVAAEEVQRIRNYDRQKHIIKSEAAWEKLFDREIPFDESERGYNIIKLVDQCFVSMDDNDIQRVLRDICNDDLVILLKGLSGKAVKRIHDNISTRLNCMLYEDMEFIGIVELSKISEIANIVFMIILNLAGKKEISGHGIIDLVLGRKEGEI